MAVPLGSRILGILTLITGILFLLFLLFLAYSRKEMKKQHPSMLIEAIWDFIRKNSIALAWLFAFAATSGSLYYSEILKYTPCELCWYQRILMYPLVLLLAIAWYRKNYRFGVYVVPMAIIGALFSAYHYMIQRIDAIGQLASCGAVGEASCTVPYTFQFGYITIPMMAFTAFVWIAILMYFGKKMNA